LPSEFSARESRRYSSSQWTDAPAWWYAGAHVCMLVIRASRRSGPAFYLRRWKTGTDLRHWNWHNTKPLAPGRKRAIKCDSHPYVLTVAFPIHIISNPPYHSTAAATEISDVCPPHCQPRTKAAGIVTS
jgi:hypothetical protein